MPPRLDELLQDCTVKITVPGGWGTGFFVAPRLILTCDHVVKALDADARAQIDWQQRSFTEAAVVERRPEVDLALLQCSPPPDVEMPCVYFGEAFQPQDELYTYGYPDKFPQGTSVTGECEGSATENSSELLVFKLAQVRPGLSGAPLLNWRTGRVCGMVKFTRDRSIDLGGGAIPSRVILEQFSQLRDLQEKFHQGDRRWQAYASEIDFEPYLQAILVDEDYREWQEVYTPTTVEDRQRMPVQDATTVSQRRFSSRLKLRVETVKPDKQGQGNQPDGTPEPQEQVEQWDVLAGLRNYAAEHVVLIGKPGSGKSTSLERLLWEEAEKALYNPTARIPVLVKLRRCPGTIEGLRTIEGLIRDFLVGHQVALEIAQIEELLRQGRFLLFLDGLNELPKAFETEIANFRDRYRRTTPMIVSTRDLGVGGTLGIEKSLKMLPLTEPQMREFVRGYLGEDGDQLFQQLSSDRLRKFAETPLLLFMLCWVFDKNGHVPSNLGLAFREFTQLHDKKIQEDAPAESKDQWPKLLRHLAFVLMNSKEPVELRLSMPREEAENLLTDFLQKEGRSNARESAERWLQDLLDYHLIQTVMQPNLEEYIEFRHQLIQEYYAAEYLLRLLPDLLKNEGKLKRDYLNLLKWTEPIALMLALVSEESQALRVVKLAMNDVDLILGARFAGEVKSTLQNRTVGQIDLLKIPLLLKCQCWGTSKSEKAVPALLSAIENSDFYIRREAIEALEKIGCRTAIFGLLNVFGDPDFGWNAAEALGGIEGEAAIPDLLKLLESQDLNIGWNAARALARIGSEAAIPDLLKLLQNSNPDVVLRAIEVLGEIGKEIAISELSNFANFSDPCIRMNAIKALGKIGSEAALPSLLKALACPDSDIACIAAEALGKICSKGSSDDLLNALNHPDIDVSYNAAQALGKIGDESTIPGLFNALRSEKSYVSRNAAEALGQIGGEIVSAELIETLQDLNYRIRRRSAAALRKNGNKNIVFNLSIKLKDEKSDLRWNSAYVLGGIGCETAIPELLEVLDDRDSFVSSYAAKALGEIGGKAAIPGLLKSLEDPRFSVRSEVVEALGKIGDKMAVPGLLQALKDQKSYIRMRATIALGEIKSEAAIPGLLMALDDPVFSVRSNAVKALGDISNNAAMPKLLKALEDRSSDVRRNAAEALGQVRDEIAVNGLLKALKDKNYDVRKSAAKALGAIGGEAAIPSLLRTFKYEDYDTFISILDAFSEIGSPLPLAKIWQLCLSQPADIFLKTISIIQNRCQFYNYDIFYDIIPQGQTVFLYFSYAPADEALEIQLANHLTLLEHQGVITSWSSHQILPGDDRTQTIHQQLNTADIILLLISPDALADDTCYHLELQRAMERHQSGHARVIPILLRPVDWQSAPFSSLSLLPKNHQPVTTWPNQDEAFQEIAAGIRETALELRRNTPTADSLSDHPPKETPE